MTVNDQFSYNDLNLRKQIYLECKSMASYALEKGKAVPANAIQNIELFEKQFGNAEEDNMPGSNETDISALAETHTMLARLVDPATPQTILLLHMEKKSGTLLKFLGPVALVRQLMMTAFISLFWFISLMATPYIDQNTLASDVLSANGLDQLARLIFYIGAAALGASFAALYKANNYISKGTFDPCYQTSYWIRFTLGIIAGLLLAILISETTIRHDGMLSNGVVRPLLAILGGFSADLLYTFLSRMVEMLKSLFESSTENIIDAKTQEAKVKFSGMEIEGRMKLAQQIMQMQQQIGKESNPELVNQQLNALLQNLMQNKSTV